jgi:hypothetical protein
MPQTANRPQVVRNRQKELGASAWKFRQKRWPLNFEDLTVYKIAYSNVDGKQKGALGA